MHVYLLLLLLPTEQLDHNSSLSLNADYIFFSHSSQNENAYWRKKLTTITNDFTNCNILSRCTTTFSIATEILLISTIQRNAYLFVFHFSRQMIFSD